MQNVCKKFEETRKKSDLCGKKTQGEMNIRRKIKPYTAAPIAHRIVREALAEYKRPNDKISEMIKKGELISIRRGLYIAGPELDLSSPHHFVIANHLRGPSYVSLESALSYWGMIPERVYDTYSATLKSTKDYETDIGRFYFQKLPSPYFSFGLKSVELALDQVALVASPEKAICDKIVLSSGVLLRSVHQAIDFLFEDMRMDMDLLSDLNTEMISSWIVDAPKKTSLTMLTKALLTL